MTSEKLRMPAEWEAHAATWIAWPHHEPDWPDKLEPVQWVYVEIVRNLANSERVEIVCHTESVAESARAKLSRSKVPVQNVRFHVLANDRSWLRDSAPTGVLNSKGHLRWVEWRFNAWAKYDNYQADAFMPALLERVSTSPRIQALRDDKQPFVLEGGAIETDGKGTMLVTEECLLSKIQERNPGLDREGYEALFQRYLGIEHTIWLGNSCEGDDTHGHIDDVARFVGPKRVVLAYEENPEETNHAASVDNLKRLQEARDAQGNALEIIKLPFPSALYFDGDRLPASYANFYIANKVVLVPTFNDPQDRHVLNTLAQVFPGREVIGIHAVDLVLGFGTLHCLTQQQPESKG